MLRAGVSKLMARATELGIRVNMTTNGTLIDKHRARELVEAGLRGVNVSLDSPIRKIHEKVRAVEGSWKKTIGAIRHFGKFARKGKLNLRVNTVVNRWNFRSLSSLPVLAHSLGVQSLNLIPVDDHCGESLALSRKQICEYNQKIAPVIAEKALSYGLIAHESQAYPFGRSDVEIKHSRIGSYAQGWYEQHPCFAPWTHSLIDYNGLVYICCMTREGIVPLGDLKTATFAEIWKGPGYQAIRERMHPPQLEQCRRCDDFLEENRRLLEIAAQQKKQSA